MRANEERSRSVSRVFDVIRPFVDGQETLHIGCVAHDAKKVESDEPWLHQFLVESSDRCLGVDILEEEVVSLREMGYEMVVADAQDMALDESFDVVVAGEVIEHLTNFDGFLQSVKRHLTDNGRLILTTPNAVALHWTVLRLLNVEFVNSEHTCWFDSVTAEQLLGRYGFQVETVDYVGDCDFRWDDILFSAGRLAELVLPDRIGKSTLVMVARLENNG